MFSQRNTSARFIDVTFARLTLMANAYEVMENTKMQQRSNTERLYLDLVKHSS